MCIKVNIELNLTLLLISQQISKGNTDRPFWLAQCLFVLAGIVLVCFGSATSLKKCYIFIWINTCVVRST